jgi:hypothetical protein
VNVPEDNRLPPAEEKRGGYSGSDDAATVPPPAKIPSGSMTSGPNSSNDK